MAYDYEILNEHIVICPMCKHRDENSRMEGGPFDHLTLLTYFCSYCLSQFGCCSNCGNSSPGGRFCVYCTPKDKRPKGLDLSQLPDPNMKREDFSYVSAGHWMYNPTGRVYNFPIDFFE